MLKLENQHLSAEDDSTPFLCQTKIWQLSRDQEGQFVFTNPLQALRRKLVVDRHFTKGTLLGDFKTIDNKDNYPLPQDLEIVLYVNWLGEYGDLVLHASGIALDGKGYAFVGPSGVGKSTLAARLKQEPGVTVLGEDQLVLRYLDGTFWIFGTPWHEDRSMCSPLGVPLEKIFFLERMDKSVLTPVAHIEGVSRLLQTAFIPYYRPEVVQHILERFEILAEAIPMAQFSYAPEENVLARILD